MANSFITPQSGMLRCMQLPGRNVLLCGGILTLLTALVITSSSYLGQLERQRRQAGRQEVRGTISLHGQPLAQGRIQFLCQATEAEVQGVDVEAPIVDGQFHFPQSEGPAPGWYIIRILLADEPAPEFSAARPIEVIRDCEHRIARIPRGTDLFVKLLRRKSHRFAIELKDHSQDSPLTQRGGESGLAASLTVLSVDRINLALVHVHQLN